MDTITLPRTGDAPLKFAGQLVAESGDNRFAGREQNRWHELALYRDNGRFVLRVAFRTNWQGEPSYDWAWVCATPAEVRERLREHDPVPERVGFPPGEQYAARQQSLEQGLRAQYDATVSELLARDEFAVSLDQDQAEQCAGMDLQAVREFIAAQLAGFPLSRAEACAFCDANNGTLLIDHCWAGLALNVFDADRLNGLGDKWSVDCKALANRIHAADLATKFALAWACAQFWRLVDQETDAALVAAGFCLGADA